MELGRIRPTGATVEDDGVQTVPNLQFGGGASSKFVTSPVVPAKNQYNRRQKHWDGNVTMSSDDEPHHRVGSRSLASVLENGQESALQGIPEFDEDEPPCCGGCCAYEGCCFCDLNCVESDTCYCAKECCDSLKAARVCRAICCCGCHKGNDGGWRRTRCMTGCCQCLGSFRKCFFGYDWSDTESGRNGILKKVFRISRKNEHLLMMFVSAIGSLADTGLDILLVWKWLVGEDPLTLEESPKHKTEAYIVIALIVLGNILSFIMVMTWGWRRCRCTGCCQAWDLLHLCGLGVLVEASRSFSKECRRPKGFCDVYCGCCCEKADQGCFRCCVDFDEFRSTDLNSYNSWKHVGRYVWIEMLVETIPALLITMYVAASDLYPIDEHGGYLSVGNELWSLEFGKIIFSICTKSFGLSGFLVQLVPMHMKDAYFEMSTIREWFPDVSLPSWACGYAHNIGERSWLRGPFATLLSVADMLVRFIPIIVFLHWWTEETNIYDAILSTVVLFGGVEFICTLIGGRYHTVWQFIFITYVCVFQGLWRYFERDWYDLEHGRVIWVFFIRYISNLGIFSWIFFTKDYADMELHGVWAWPFCVSAALLPLLFFLKPNVVPLFDSFPGLKPENLGMEYRLKRRRDIFKLEMQSERMAMPDMPGGAPRMDVVAGKSHTSFTVGSNSSLGTPRLKALYRKRQESASETDTNDVIFDFDD